MERPLAVVIGQSSHLHANSRHRRAERDAAKSTLLKADCRPGQTDRGSVKVDDEEVTASLKTSAMAFRTPLAAMAPNIRET